MKQDGLSAVAVDLGGTNFKAALFDPNDELIDSFGEPAEKDESEVLIAQFQRAVERFRGVSGAVLGPIGVGVPGNVNLRRRTVEASPNYGLLTRFDLFAALTALGLSPVSIDNDANAAALGEALYGTGAGAGATLIFVSLGTGVGGGIVIDGEVLHGSSGYAGELGHIVVEADGEPCGCGGWGCLEQSVSAPAIVRRARRKRREYPESKWVPRATSAGEEVELTAERVAAGALALDPLCTEVMAEVGRALGIALAGLVNVFNPSSVVLGGGVALAGEILLRPTVEEARRRAFRRPFEDCRFSLSTLGADAGLFGALALARGGQGTDR